MTQVTIIADSSKTKIEILILVILGTKIVDSQEIKIVFLIEYAKSPLLHYDCVDVFEVHGVCVVRSPTDIQGWQGRRRERNSKFC